MAIVLLAGELIYWIVWDAFAAAGRRGVRTRTRGARLFHISGRALVFAPSSAVFGALMLVGTIALLLGTVGMLASACSIAFLADGVSALKQFTELHRVLLGSLGAVLGLLSHVWIIARDAVVELSVPTSSC